MSKRIRFQSVAALFVSSAIIVSCINVDKTVGEGFVPTDQELKVKLTSVDIPVQMKMDDSLQSIFPSYLIVGSYTDADFGQTICGTAFQMIPITTENDFGDNPVPEYLRMEIYVSKALCLNQGEESIPQNIYLYALINDLDSTTLFNNSIKRSDYSNTPLNIGTAVYTGGDSINIEMNLDYAKLLLTASKDERDSTSIFKERFKGFFLATEPMPGSLKGGRFNMIDPSYIYMVMKYRHVSAEDDIDKDSIVNYYVSTSNCFYTNIFSHGSKNLESEKPSGKILMEGMAGIKPYLDFSEIRKNFKTWADANGLDLTKVLIAKASLVLPFEFPNDYTIMGQYPTQVFLAAREYSDTYDIYTYQPLDDIQAVGAGAINRSLFNYTIDISTFLQHVFNNTLTDIEMKTWLTPISTATSSYTGSTTYYVDSQIYSKAVINGMNDTRKPHIEITYTVMP